MTIMDSPKILVKKSSQKEKHTVVDPMTLEDSSFNHGFFETSHTIFSTTMAFLPLRPLKPKFLSHSLPNSANSSPGLTSAMFKKNTKVAIWESRHQASNLTLKDHHLQQEINLRRSKSWGERWDYELSDELDLWLLKSSIAKHANRSPLNEIQSISAGIIVSNESCGSFSKEKPLDRNLSGGDGSLEPEEGFKCNALCLHLLSFGKSKQLKERKKGQEMEGALVSRRVSLEKFECGSWASSTLFQEIEGRDSKSTSTYFDLPMELIKWNANDVDAPISSAFVFEKDHDRVLNNGSSRTSLDSQESYISPRLRKAREDFNAFLEAQNV
ncbi:uncharacterized protein LOC130975237 [Arachis stenosperma]|uniref:uncharacterized protein LOC130975237 n=1 Tax=Arachis stenosperma TaxID=217475 RepID=UPI0025AC8D6C|nr:uncharacterized protein LOC130975237 [Arachis stenosperma]